MIRLNPRSTLGCYAIILPGMALLLTFIYLPVVWAFSNSFYEFEVGGQSRVCCSQVDTLASRSWVCRRL